ncbi:hypothetical protein ACMD2_04917 [Ananas comosus]|uniref:PAP-associated domain-containing protein n=1 Tax=Ananas comosus TaxID=4615 RepID=A0A199VTE1_ANACO|nr:hypothetical protein ACMD2_04917 [Ananas comosus]
MGDFREWAAYGSSAVARGYRAPTLAAAMAQSLSHPVAIRRDSLRAAERRAADIVARVRPTDDSESKRKSVVAYVQKLIGVSLGSEVFPFGSVPLKTYLPDGDIDLTAFGSAAPDSTLISDVRCILEYEEQNSDAEFEVKDVQYINAEVRLVKCLIDNIIVDISFNQMGGLCTLCFLELVDRHIGKDHLFKRSIILIKAWCYYESRILGAHHGLISTYALETLVLYIFNLFHKTMDGPLAVLYRFLEYFSNFDWDNYCISLYGPVAIASLPDIVIEDTDIRSADLLLSQEFVKRSIKKFSLPLTESEKSSAKFCPKYLNIIDPLRENNNLGRSVSKGNFFRIRSAFSYGARKLCDILILPRKYIENELSLFFANTLEMHGNGQRPDLQRRMPSGLRAAESNYSGFNPFSSGLEIEKDKKVDSTSQGTLCEQRLKKEVSNLESEIEKAKRPLRPANGLTKLEPRTKNANQTALPSTENGASFSLNFRAYKERFASSRGKKQAYTYRPPKFRSNNQEGSATDKSLKGKDSQEAVPPPKEKVSPSNGNGRGKLPASDAPPPPRLLTKGHSPANGFIVKPEGSVEFGSRSAVPLAAFSPELRMKASVAPHNQRSAVTYASAAQQRSGADSTRERPTEPYKLKDEGDFPPLSGLKQ